MFSDHYFSFINDYTLYVNDGLG